MLFSYSADMWAIGISVNESHIISHCFSHITAKVFLLMQSILAILIFSHFYSCCRAIVTILLFNVVNAHMICILYSLTKR
jgi:hypothetical protein